MTHLFARKHSHIIVPICLTLLVALNASAQTTETTPAQHPTVSVTPDGTLTVQVDQGAGDEPSLNTRELKRKVGTSGALDGAQPVFLPVVTYDSGGSQGRAVAVGDVNGDGHLDIVMVNLCPSNVPDCYEGPPSSVDGTVSVSLGNGDGTFQTPQVYDSGGADPAAVTIKDVNGDGKPDLVVVNECADGAACSYTSVSVLLNNGNGTFQAARSYAAGGSQGGGPGLAAFPNVVAEDVNNDGKPDLVVTNVCDIATDCADGGVGVLLGNGDGTFQTAVVYDADGQWTSSLSLGDLNGDGQPDIVLTNCGPQGGGGCGGEGDVAVLLGKGDGTFQPAVLYDSGGSGTLSLALGDVNGDGKLDLVTSSLAPPGGDQYCGNGFVDVLLGNGDGTFLPPAAVYSPVGCLPFSTVIADVNADGVLDLVVSSCGEGNGCSHGFVNVLLGNSDGTFGQPTTFDSGWDTLGAVVADVNGDGRPDIIAADLIDESGLEGSVGVLLNDTASSRASTATTVASSLNPSSYGQALTFTAEVTSGSGTPTGRMLFFDGSFLLGSAALANGSASFTTSTLAAYSHPITAAYQGSGSFATSTSAVLKQVVTGSSSKTSLASSVNPSIFGQTVTLTAMVSSASGTPTGVVVFYDGSTSLGGATLAGGSAAFAISTLAVGSHTITAAYQGAGAFDGSTSKSIRQVVNTASTTTSLGSSANPAHKNQKVTYTATVIGQFGGAATGTVTFRDGGATLATVNVSGNQAAYTTSYPAAGAHPISATYSGDANNAGSTSPVLEEVIGKAPFSSETTLATSGSPSHVGQPVTFTATVTSKDGAIPDGEMVAFYDGKIQIGAGATSGGIATFTTSSLTAKKHTIKATYAGDGIFKTSTGKVTQVVEK